MLQIEENKFADNLSQFFFNTLLIKKEVILALEGVKKECIRIKDFNVFNPIDCSNGPNKKIYRLDEFKQTQESQIS